jgi:hypothetical protein
MVARRIVRALFGLGSAVMKNRILSRRIAKVFAVKSNAEVNPRHTCDGGDVKFRCREKHCHIS